MSALMFARSSRERAAILILVLFASGLSACGSSDDDAGAIQEPRIIKLIDQQRYDDVIRILEPRRKDPQARDLIAYLAMAHLGAAGFEPLQLARRVLGKQEKRDPVLEALVPGCDKRAISWIDQTSVKCVFKRLWNILPDPDETHFAQARTILRERYPVPESTPPRHNMLLGMLDAVTTVARIGRILRAYQAIDPLIAPDAEITALFTEAGRAAEAAALCLGRARYMAKRITELLTGLENLPIFVSNRFSLQWAETTGLPLVEEMTLSNSAGLDRGIFRVILIQKIDQLVSKFKE